MDKVFTIGHSTHEISYFLNLLVMHKINCIVDVWSNPASKFASQYNRSELRYFLERNSIYYVFMGEEFGAKRSDPSLYAPEGFVDFEKVIKSSLFNQGLDRVISGISKGYRVALMCAEKDPIDCHRSILVARAFNNIGYCAYNIRADGKLEDQKHLVQRLLDLYFPSRNQITIFDMLEGGKSETDYIEEAYRARNRDIGYSYKKKDEECKI